MLEVRESLENQPRLLNVKEVAVQLCCSGQLIYKMVIARKIRCIRIAPRCLRFNQEEVDRILSSWKEVNYVPLEDNVPIVRKDRYLET